MRTRPLSDWAGAEPKYVGAKHPLLRTTFLSTLLSPSQSVRGIRNPLLIQYRSFLCPDGKRIPLGQGLRFGRGSEAQGLHWMTWRAWNRNHPCCHGGDQRIKKISKIMCLDSVLSTGHIELFFFFSNSGGGARDQYHIRQGH